MFCGPVKWCDFCRDRNCELCRSIRRRLIGLLVWAAATVTFGVIALVMLFGCVSVDEACEPTQHLDTTGNTIDCACDCEGEDACPLIPGSTRSRVPDCWEEGTSSET